MELGIGLTFWYAKSGVNPTPHFVIGHEPMDMKLGKKLIEWMRRAITSRRIADGLRNRSTLSAPTGSGGQNNERRCPILFVLRPDNDGIAARSKAFIMDQAKFSERRLETMQTRYDDAMQKHDVHQPSWSDSSAMNKAEEELEEAKAVHAGDLVKLAWESSRQWMRNIKVNPKQMPHPWRDDIKNWLRIFRERQNKPPTTETQW